MTPLTVPFYVRTKMSDIQGFLCDAFEEEYCSKTLSERKEFLSSFLNDDKNCVLYEELLNWIDEALHIIVPDAPENFKLAISRSIDINEMREDLFRFIDCEGDLTIADEEVQ